MSETDIQNAMLANQTKPYSDCLDDPGPSPMGIKSSYFLFIFALVFRMIYVIQSTDNPLFGVPLVDAVSYVQWAGKMVDGIWLWDSVANYLPIYPAFLAVQEIIFGPHPLVNKVLQSMMGATTAVLLAQVAARTWNRRVGLISGYLIATNWMLAIYDSEKFAETFSIFFLSLTLWLLIRYSGRSGALLAAGFALALAAGARANFLLVLPCVIYWLLRLNRNSWRAGFKSAVLFGCGTLVIIGPILARNYYLSGMPMLRAQATWSLYSGLAPEFKGLHPPAGILFDKYMHLAQQSGALSVPAAEKFWARELWQVIKTDPIGVLLNFGRRVVIFVNAREWSQEFDVAAYRNYSRFLALPWTGFWLIGPLGLLGLLMSRRSTPSQQLMILITIAVILSIIPFKVSDRYRLPPAVLLTLFAAAALWSLFTGYPSRQKKVFYKWLALGLVFCLVAWPDWQNLTARKSARHDFFVGRHYESTGRLPEAVEAYQKSMEAFLWDADSPYRLGIIFARRDQHRRSIEYLRQALQREPAFPQVLNELARHQMRADDLIAAEKQLLTSLELAPGRVDTAILMAELQRRKGDPQREIAYLMDAVEMTGRHRPAMRLADRLVELGNYEDAIGLYEWVMRSRQVDKSVRVIAGMLAGVTTARYLSPTSDDKIYWNFVINEFDEFKFFSLQAHFLNGTLAEPEFRRQMADSPIWEVSAEYIIGLKHRLDGNAASAAVAFERCLKIEVDTESRNRYSPQQWAREDLKRLEQRKSR